MTEEERSKEHAEMEVRDRGREERPELERGIGGGRLLSILPRARDKVEVEEGDSGGSRRQAERAEIGRSQRDL
ncbi:unnamed protein product [Linum trigynum]|uniref:Uncharacterized protein n=1 Tax=Linum trigynum TaxID=586398 RepID=A0AAV2CJP9_9ROSI